MTRWCAWRRTSTCAIPWSTARETSVRSTATRRRRCATPKRVPRRWPKRCWRISTRNSRLRPELRRNHRGADGPADDVPEPAGERFRRHRRRHGDQHSAAQPERGDRRLHRGDRAAQQPRDVRIKKLLRTVSGPDFPTGGFIYGRTGIFDAYTTGRGSIMMRARVSTEESKKGDKTSLVDHRDSVPGEQGAADREDRRAGPREEARGHFGPARRVGPRRHAHRDRAEARRGARSGPQQPLQAHADADDVRRHHAGDRRQPPAR